MGEEYVQEHILTGGIVAPVEGASPTHSSPLTAISLSVVASYPTHLWRKSRSAHNGYDFPMVYRDIYFPVMQGMNVRIGRFISVPHIESKLAPNSYISVRSLIYTSPLGLAALFFMLLLGVSRLRSLDP
jgi:hypothetical protein